MPMPAGLTPIGPGHHPLTRNDCIFYLSDDALEKIKSDTPWKFEDEHLLPDAVGGKTPCIAFKGLIRKGYLEAYCFATKPSNPPQPGVFLVYFVDGPPNTFSGPVIIDWDWREEDNENQGFPKNYEEDFGALLWQRT